MSELSVPNIGDDMGALDAALAYAKAGWYVGPVRAGTKHPGSVIGDPVTKKGWQHRTSREAEVIVAWLAGTSHGVFLHCGRSGAVVFDVDTPEKLHPLIAKAAAEASPPWQSTRPDEPARRHYLFAQPPGRMLGNSVGRLGGAWGEVRGRNGVIVVAPSVHAEGGRYEWGRRGTVPALPGYLLAELPDALDAADAATDAQVQGFLDAHQGQDRLELLEVHLQAFKNKVADGASRHDTMTGHLAGAMKEARLGCYPADIAADTLQSAFEEAVKAPGHGRQGKARTAAEARSEWRGLLAWAVAQAAGADLDAVRTRLAEKVPDVTGLTTLPSVTSAPVSPVDGPEAGAATIGTATEPLGRSWLPQDLDDVVRGLQDGTLSRPAPVVGRFDGSRALFYPRRVNGIHGDSNAGKTWSALVCCAQEIRDGGTAVYVDLEDDAAGVVSRLLDMGADPDDILARFVYISPSDRLDATARGLLAGMLAERAPTLVVIDSTGEGLALDGANPNADEEVARWFRSMPRFIADRGPAVLVLDHMAKADDGALWPIGSQRKRAAIDGAQYAQRVVRPFSRDTAGAAVLICAKDRGGNYRAGQRVAELHVTPDGEGVRVELTAGHDDHAGPGGLFRPTVLMERVSRALELAREPLTFNDIAERVKGKRTGVRAATDVLVVEGHITTQAGARNATLHSLAKPYREADDTGEPVEPRPTGSTGSTGSGSLGGEPGTSGGTGSGNQSGTSGNQSQPGGAGASRGALDSGAVACSSCGSPLLLVIPGRDTCERCRITRERAHDPDDIEAQPEGRVHVGR